MAEQAVKRAKPDLEKFDLVGAGDGGIFRSPRLEALFRYWGSRREGALPQRADIDPSEIKPLLPYLILTDIHRDPFRIFYRLVGTVVVHYSGMDFTGRYLDDLAFDISTTKHLLHAYQAVCERRQPGRGFAFAQITNQSALDVEYLICPLVDAAGTVTQCLAIEDYVTADDHEAGHPRMVRRGA